MSLTALERPAVGEPEGALVLLHGRGADEHDLFPLLDALDPRQRLHGYTPRAPLALPPGGAHWYIVPRVGFPDHDTFHASYELLSDWLDALPFPPEQIVLGGFSQGAVMAYSLGLGAGRPRPVVAARPQRVHPDRRRAGSPISSRRSRRSRSRTARTTR